MPLNRDKIIAFDVETGSQYDTKYALQPFRAMHYAADITSYATAAYGHGKLRTHAVRDPDRVTLSDFLQHAIDNKLTIIGWNVAFDAAWLIGYGLGTQVAQAKWLDGMLLWQHLTREPEYEIQRTKKQSYGLKTAVAKYIPKHAGYGDEVDFFDNSPDMVAKRLRYNKMDAAFTLQLTEKFYNQLEKVSAQSLRNALIEASAIVPVAQSIVHGLHVDAEHAHAMQVNLADRQAEIGEVLEEYGLTDKVLASPKQLSEKLYDEWGLPVLSETPKGGRSTDKVALHLLAAHDERVAHIREYRECANNRTKFVDKILDSVAYNEDGCTRPWPRIYGTYSGRVTYNSSQGRGKEQVQTGFALHQMKRAKDFRKIIKAPPGYVLCEWDAAGQEYRWMAVESNDSTMLTLCEPGQDPHSYMGAEIAHRDYFELIVLSKGGDTDGKNVRQMGKVGNLSCVVADTEVLTLSGRKRIVDVAASDLIWDGVEFVSHGGAVFNGYRKTVTYQGLTATEDHQVLCQGVWTDFGRAASEGRAIDTAVWPMDDSVRPSVRGQFTGEGALPLRVWAGIRRCAGVAHQWAQHRLSRVWQQSVCAPCWETGCGEPRRPSPAETCQRNAAEMPEQQRSVLCQLRWAWDRVSVRLNQSLCRMGEGAPAASDILGRRHRPRGQLRSLRAGELTAGYTQPQPTQHAEHRDGVLAWQASAAARLGTEPVLHHSGGADGGERVDWGANHSAGMDRSGPKAEELAQHEGEVAVYDILNCGPRNRFVANGLIIHNCQYRIGAKKLWVTATLPPFNMPIDMTEASHIIETYHRTYPGVKQYWARQIMKCRRSGYAETLAGRRVQLKGSWTNRQTAWQLESSAVNFPIQGIGADQKYLAIKVLQNYLLKYGGRFYFELHDGLYGILPERKAEEGSRAIRRALSNLPYQKAWGFTPPIPLPWDLKMGANWGEMTEVESE